MTEKEEQSHYYMSIALEEAQLAYGRGEVPVGAVIVKDNHIIARAGNTREAMQDPFGHAEMNVIAIASKKLGVWRLSGCTLYVTLEPCPMWAGAIVNARIDKLVYGACDTEGGCVGSKIHLFDLDFNHRPAVSCGVLAQQCKEILTRFFREKR